MFYRAVASGELAVLQHNYPQGEQWAHATVPGDFSHAGGLYVFEVRRQLRKSCLFGSNCFLGHGGGEAVGKLLGQGPAQGGEQALLCHQIRVQT